MIFYDNKFIENTHHNVQAGCPSQEPLGSLTLAIALTAFGYSGNTANMPLVEGREGARYIFFGSESTVSSHSSHL